jgi:hypothetical protein
MPKPHYIICSLDGSEDKYTGRVSIFSIIDRVHINRPKQDAMPIVALRITAAWLRIDADTDKEFEFQFVAKVPPFGREIELSSGRFVFQEPIARLIGTMLGGLPVEGSGNLVIECRVRPTGEEQWASQEYQILVDQGTTIDDATTGSASLQSPEAN